MNTVNISNFNFSDAIVDHKVDETKFFSMYRNWMNIVQDQNESIASVVHALFLPLNGPKTPATTAKRMQDFAAALVKKWTEDVPESQRVSKDHMKLSGNNPFASAFKKLIGAVEHGGDLNELDTISKCEKFRREKNKEKNKQNSLNLITAEQRSLLIEERPDLVPDSPEFLEELTRRVNKLTGTDEVKHSASGDTKEKVKSPLDLALEELCAAYREVAVLHGNENQAIEMAIAEKKKVLSTIEKIKQAVIARMDAAKKTGTEG